MNLLIKANKYDHLQIKEKMLMKSSPSHCVSDLSSIISFPFWLEWPVCTSISTYHVASLMWFLCTAYFILLAVGSCPHIILLFNFIALLWRFWMLRWWFIDWFVQRFILCIDIWYFFVGLWCWFEVFTIVIWSIPLKWLILIILFEFRGWFSLLLDPYAMWA